MDHMALYNTVVLGNAITSEFYVNHTFAPKGISLSVFMQGSYAKNYRQPSKEPLFVANMKPMNIGILNNLNGN